MSILNSYKTLSELFFVSDGQNPFWKKGFWTPKNFSYADSHWYVLHTSTPIEAACILLIKSFAGVQALGEGSRSRSFGPSRRLPYQGQPTR